MNREIKFRAWIIEDQVMMSWDDIDGSDNAGSIMFLDMLKDELNFKIMQYTGLKDRNGKEIYEGDIGYALIGRYSEPKKPFLAVVKCDRCFWSYWEAERNTLHEIWPNDQFEIIGNIHENHNLLEG